MDGRGRRRRRRARTRRCVSWCPGRRPAARRDRRGERGILLRAGALAGRPGRPRGDRVRDRRRDAGLVEGDADDRRRQWHDAAEHARAGHGVPVPGAGAPADRRHARCLGGRHHDTADADRRPRPHDRERARRQRSALLPAHGVQAVPLRLQHEPRGGDQRLHGDAVHDHPRAPGTSCGASTVGHRDRGTRRPGTRARRLAPPRRGGRARRPAHGDPAGAVLRPERPGHVPHADESLLQQVRRSFPTPAQAFTRGSSSAPRWSASTSTRSRTGAARTRCTPSTTRRSSSPPLRKGSRPSSGSKRRR